MALLPFILHCVRACFNGYFREFCIKVVDFLFIRRIVSQWSFSRNIRNFVHQSLDKLLDNVTRCL